ncbi:hypothetical protein CspHIS471_0407560 [Cutaneotrichosporon sp. HIS471]|nr:hypothetical protein CspHIS471_0407560 [Cutaneotrichosporon sp. HIS471]
MGDGCDEDTSPGWGIRAPFRFVFITSLGVSQAPGWFAPAYVRVKGETEAALRRAGGISAVFVRPGGILATEERRPELIWYNRVILDALSYVWPSGVIQATKLAQACLCLATGEGWELRNPEGAVENNDLKLLALGYEGSPDPGPE